MNNEQLKDFVNNPDSEFDENDCYGHFEDKEERWSKTCSPWVDVIKEGERIYNLNTDVALEEGSVLDCLISAMNASSWCVAIRIMARILHFDYEALRAVLEECDESDGYEELAATVNKAKKELDEINV